MKKKTLIISIFAILISCILLVVAIDFNPNGDIDLHGLWKIKNATSVITNDLNVSNMLNVLGGVTGLNNKITVDCGNVTGSSGSLCTNQTLAAITFINTASTNLQSNISAVNTSLISEISTSSTNLQANISAVNTSLISGMSNLNLSLLAKMNNVSWTNLSDFPVACPAGSFISQLGNSVICTSGENLSVNVSSYSNSTIWWNNLNSTNTNQFQNVGGALTLISGWFDSYWCSLTGCSMTGNIAMGKNNVSDIKYSHYANITSSSAWRSYVNDSNSFIIEVSS